MKLRDKNERYIPYKLIKRIMTKHLPMGINISKDSIRLMEMFTIDFLNFICYDSCDSNGTLTSENIITTL